MPKKKPQRRQVNATLSNIEFQLIAKMAKAARRSTAQQLKLMALAFVRQNRVIEQDFALLVQSLRRLRSLAEDHAFKAGGWHKLSVPQLKKLAEKIDQWEERLERFLKLS